LSKDTIDRGALELRRWFPMNIVSRQQFLATHRVFFVYSPIGSWNWLTYVLVPPYYETRLLDRRGDRLLLTARRLSDNPADATSPQSQYPDALFNKISKDGPSLCKQWMPGDGL